ncbi:MAG: hypothetical protein JKY53_07655 [Flavobacteriales bacterium]|nr:hypothetical protein [Flavobacteriales bacterium]
MEGLFAEKISNNNSLSSLHQTMRFSILILLSVIFFAACRKDKEVSTIDLGTDYFPREVGSWIIYDVDSIIHDDNDDQQGFIDTVSYLLKEIIESEFTDTTGVLNQRIERYVKMSDTTDWVILDVWSSLVNKSRAEQVEENIKFIKLVFPPQNGDSWNGNAYNTLGEQDYEYTSVDVTETINDVALDSVLTIEQLNDVNIIEREYAEEKYARGVGRVSRTYIFIDIQDQSGVEYYEVINSFGN